MAKKEQVKDNLFQFRLSTWESPIAVRGVRLTPPNAIWEGESEKWVTAVKKDDGRVVLDIIYPQELYFYESLDDMKSKALDKRGKFGESIWDWVVKGELKNMKKDILSIENLTEVECERLQRLCDRLEDIYDTVHELRRRI